MYHHMFGEKKSQRKHVRVSKLPEVEEELRSGHEKRAEEMLVPERTVPSLVWRKKSQRKHVRVSKLPEVEEELRSGHEKRVEEMLVPEGKDRYVTSLLMDEGGQSRCTSASRRWQL